MATLARLVVELGMEDRNFDKGMNGAKAKASSWADSMISIGQRASVALTAPLALFGKGAIDAAVDASETLNKANVVFGENAQDVIKWAEGSAEKLGMADHAALAAAASVGNMVTSMGVVPSVAADMSTGVVGLTADLASFNNMAPEEVFQKLNAGISGEYEGLKSLGIVLNDTMVKQYALEKGYAATEAALTPAMLAQARYELIMQKSTNAHGDFIETADGVANRQRILKARFGDLQRELGKRLLPIWEKVLDGAFKLMDVFDNLSPAAQKLAVYIGLAAAAFGPLLIVLGTVIKYGGQVKQALNIVKLLTALSPPILAVVAALALFAIAYRNIEPFRDFINNLGSRLLEFAEDFISVFTRLRSEGVAPIEAAIRAFGSALEDLLGIEMSGWFMDLAGGVQKLFDNLISLADAILTGDWSRALESLKNIGEIVINGTIRLGGNLKDLVGKGYQWLKWQLFGSDPSVVGDGTGGPMGAGVAEFGLGDVAIRIGKIIVNGLESLAGAVVDKAVKVWNDWDRKITLGNLTISIPSFDPDSIEINVPALDMAVDQGFAGLEAIQTTLDNVNVQVKEPPSENITVDTNRSTFTQKINEKLGQMVDNIPLVLPVMTFAFAYGFNFGAQVLADFTGSLRRFIDVNQKPVDIPGPIKMILPKPILIGIQFGAGFAENIRTLIDGLQKVHDGPLISLLIPEPVILIFWSIWNLIKLTIGDISMLWPDSWGLTLPSPTISLGLLGGTGLVLAVWSAIKSAWNGKISWPDWDLSLGVPDVIGSVLGGIENFDGIHQTVSAKVRAAWDGLVNWPSWDLKLKVPTVDLPDIAAAVIAKIRELYPDGLSVPWPSDLPFNISWPDALGGKSMEGLDGLKGPELAGGGMTVAVSVGINTAPFMAGFENLMLRINTQWVSKTWTTKYDVDNTLALLKNAAATLMGKRWEDRTWISKYDINPQLAQRQHDSAMLRGLHWSRQIFTSKINADPTNAFNSINRAFEAGNSWDGAVFQARITMDTSALDNALFKVQTRMQQIRDLLPSSPAKRGPMSKPVSFKYIADQAERDLRGIGSRISEELGFAPRYDPTQVSPTTTLADLADLARNQQPQAVIYQVLPQELVKLMQDAGLGAKVAKDLAPVIKSMS